MKIFKKSVLYLLLVALVFTLTLNFASCKNSNVKSQVLILSEESYNASVKPKDGKKLSFSAAELQEKTEESIIIGKKYYALIYLSGKTVGSGRISLSGNVTVTDTAINSSKSSQQLSVQNGGKENVLNIKNSGKAARSNVYISVCFTVNDASEDGENRVDAAYFGPTGGENEKLSGYSGVIVGGTDGYYTGDGGFSGSLGDLGLSGGIEVIEPDENELTVKVEFSENTSGIAFPDSVSHSVPVLYNKQVYAEGSVNYLKASDYDSGSFDGKITDSISTAPKERFYIVIDYFIKVKSAIEEDDVITLSISTWSNNCDGYKLSVADFPTGEYSDMDGVITASFKPYGAGTEGRKYRFIISVISENEGTIELTARLSGEKISVIESDEIITYFDVGDKATESKLSYTLSNDGTHYIVSGLGQESDDVINIPSKYKGIPVKEIGVGAFSNYNHIKEVTLPLGLERICSHAFDRCGALKSIIIPESVTVIEENAFTDSPNTNVYCEVSEKPDTWSDGFASAETYVTWNYNELFILNSDETSYSFSYYGNRGERVCVPDTYKGLPVTEISDMAFFGVGELVSVRIPSTVIYIGAGVFTDCFSLESIEVSGENEAYTSIDGSLYTKDGKTLLQYAVAKTTESFTVPDTVIRIESLAFYGCTSLRYVTLGSSVESIGNGAFLNCTSLLAINYRGSAENWAYVNKGNYWDCCTDSGSYLKLSYTLNCDYEGN